MFNVLGVSLSLGMLKSPTHIMHNAIESIFSGKKAVAELNVKAATFAYNYAAAKFTDINFSFESVLGAQALSPPSKCQVIPVGCFCRYNVIGRFLLDW